MHDDRAVEPGHLVGAGGAGSGGQLVVAAHHVVPPGVFEIPLELNAERSVIPKAIKAAVDFAGLKNEPTSLGERNNAVHTGLVRRLFHGRECSRRSRTGSMTAASRRWTESVVARCGGRTPRTLATFLGFAQSGKSSPRASRQDEGSGRSMPESAARAGTVARLSRAATTARSSCIPRA